MPQKTLPKIRPYVEMLFQGNKAAIIAAHDSFQDEHIGYVESEHSKKELEAGDTLNIAKLSVPYKIYKLFFAVGTFQKDYENVPTQSHLECKFSYSKKSNTGQARVRFYPDEELLCVKEYNDYMKKVLIKEQERLVDNKLKPVLSFDGAMQSFVRKNCYHV
jgi:hypothetical protein